MPWIWKPFASFSLDARLALLTDPSPQIAGIAAGKIGDAETLRRAVDVVSLDRLEYFLLLATQRSEFATVRAIFERLPADHALARKCVESLWNADPDVLIDAVAKAEAAPTPASGLALQILESLGLPAQLKDRVSAELEGRRPG